MTFLYLAARQEEGVAIRVLEVDVRERLCLRRSQKLHASRSKLFVGVVHVVASKGAVEEGSDPILVPMGRQQQQASLGAGNGQFDLALLPDETIGGDDAAHGLGPKGQRPILVRSRDAHIVDPSEHLAPPKPISDHPLRG